MKVLITMNINLLTADSMKADDSKNLRRVRWDEVVRQGDFVVGGKGFEPWEGPSGFRADSFLKPIYRTRQSIPTGPDKNEPPKDTSE
jgi:hypothetical protein